jgi:hypothetical protein
MSTPNDAPIITRDGVLRYLPAPNYFMILIIPFGGCRPFVAFRSAKGFPVMNTTFRGAKGDSGTSAGDQLR